MIAFIKVKVEAFLSQPQMQFHGDKTSIDKQWQEGTHSNQLLFRPSRQQSARCVVGTDFGGSVGGCDQ
jgi:hypothetical protein